MQFSELQKETDDIVYLFKTSPDDPSIAERLHNLLTIDNISVMAQLAYLTIIDQDINEVIRQFLNLPSLTFIPRRNWSRDVDDIIIEGANFPKPLILEVETLSEVSEEYYNFLFQMDDTRTFREEAFKTTLKIDKEKFIHQENSFIFRPHIKKQINVQLVRLNKEIWQIMKDLQVNITVREFYFFELLSLIMKEALVNQSLRLKEQLIQLSMFPELFLFPITFHTRSIMFFANIEVIDHWPEDHFALGALPNSITMEYLELNPEDKMAIPVMRYQSASGTLFFNNAEDTEHHSFCGTFYYFEPESDIYLLSDHVLMAVNKIHAAAILGFDIDYILELLFYPEERESYRESVKLYMQGDVLPFNLYAIEDGLDQIICEEAKLQGYKVIVLVEMVGTYRYVTEILDTRNRSESFKNLIHLKSF